MCSLAANKNLLDTRCRKRPKVPIKALRCRLSDSTDAVGFPASSTDVRPAPAEVAHARESSRGGPSAPPACRGGEMGPSDSERLSTVNPVYIGSPSGKVFFRRCSIRSAVRDDISVTAAPASVSVSLLRLWVLNGRNGYTSACESYLIGSRICRRQPSKRSTVSRIKPSMFPHQTAPHRKPSRRTDER